MCFIILQEHASPWLEFRGKSAYTIPQSFVFSFRYGTLTTGFLYGAGAETRIFVTGTSGNNRKNVVSRQKNQSQLCIPRKPRNIGVWVSGAGIQTSAVDTRTAAWVSTAEKVFKMVLGETRIFLESLGGSQRRLCIKTRPSHKFFHC